MPMCLACLHANVPCVHTCSRGNVPSVLSCVYMPCVPCTLTWQIFICFYFFEVKLFFCPVLYWDEKSLFIEKEARRITRNALVLKGSSKIMVSQIHLRFFINLTNNGHFIDVDPVKHISSSLLQK